MKATAGLLLAAAAAASVTVIDVGGTKITIPDPPGLAPVTEEMTALYDVLERLVPEPSRGFVSFIPAEHVAAALAGEVPALSRHCSVQTPKSFVPASIAPGRFEQLKATARAQQEKRREAVRETWPLELASIDEGRGSRRDLERALAVAPVVMVRPHHESDRKLAYSSFAMLDTTDPAGAPRRSITALTTTLVLVQRKALFLHCHADASDFEWTRTASRVWAEAVLDANAAVPADPEREAAPDSAAWARPLLWQLDFAVERVDAVDLERSHQPTIGRLEEGETRTAELELEAGATFLVGACDDACSDLDLIVETAEGEPVAADRGHGDNPVAHFRVPEPGGYRVGVHMASCTREPCGFVVQPYAAYPAGSRPPSAERPMDDEHLDRAVLAVVRHTTAEEFLRVLAWREDIFRRIADDPVARESCGLRSMPERADGSSLDFQPISAILDRALARDLAGEALWSPPASFAANGRAMGREFAYYLHENGHDQVLAPFVKLAEGRLEESEVCTWLADLYAVAIEAPEDRIGDMTMLDVVRVLELAGQGRLGATN